MAVAESIWQAVAMRIRMDPPIGTSTDVIMEQALKALSLIGVCDNGSAIIKDAKRFTEYGAILVPDSEADKAIAELKRRGIRAFAGSRTSPSVPACRRLD